VPESDESTSTAANCATVPSTVGVKNCNVDNGGCDHICARGACYCWEGYQQLDSQCSPGGETYDLRDCTIFTLQKELYFLSRELSAAEVSAASAKALLDEITDDMDEPGIFGVSAGTEGLLAGLAIVVVVIFVASKLSKVSRSSATPLLPLSPTSEKCPELAQLPVEHVGPEVEMESLPGSPRAATPSREA
jgi:hypothetical protein